MAAPLLIPILVIAVALIFGRGSGKKGSGIISAYELENLTSLPGGNFRYKPEAVLLGALSLQSKSLLPTQDPNVFGLRQYFSLDEVEPSFAGATQVANAYEGAKDLHARGFDIWVTPTLFPKKDQVFAERYLSAVSPGQPPPKLGTLPQALFRLASEPWLEEEALPPPPPPADIPPPPLDVPVA